MCLVGKNILMVGIKDRKHALRSLPVRVLMLDTGAQAIRCLREERIDTLVSHWDMVDLPAGCFLQRLTAARPDMPTIAFIKPGDTYQEIAARSLGVDAVLSEDVDDAMFREAVCQLLHISTVSSVQLATNG